MLPVSTGLRTLREIWMFDSVKEIFEGAAGKYLSAVDAEKSRSHQHEIGGLPKVGFKRYLGEPGKHEEYRFPCTMAYITEGDDIELCTDEVTWYDSRRKSPHRSPEYRLYYKDNPVTERIKSGDFLLVAKKKDNSLILVFTAPGSTAEFQLRHLFGIGIPESGFSAAIMPEHTLLLPLKLLLEELGIAAFGEENHGNDLDLLLERFPDRLPRTHEFSSLARELSSYDAHTDPDKALVGWMEREETLFRTYERHIVKERLIQGFGARGDDVDEFISFSLSVQNRRKSRVGHAFENHLEFIFSENGLEFEKGSHKKVTENNSKPDFMFPSFTAYHDKSVPDDRIFLLGAKTTCKDRWRQVLAEGDRLQKKYLATLEASISTHQTNEMRSKNLQLIVPSPIQYTYDTEQISWLFSISDFIQLVKEHSYH